MNNVFSLAQLNKKNRSYMTTAHSFEQLSDTNGLTELMKTLHEFFRDHCKDNEIQTPALVKSFQAAAALVFRFFKTQPNEHHHLKRNLFISFASHEELIKKMESEETLDFPLEQNFAALIPIIANSKMELTQFELEAIRSKLSPLIAFGNKYLYENEYNPG